MALTQAVGSGVASPKIGGVKMIDFRRITLFCVEKRISKHKMTIFSKNLGDHGPFRPPSLATPMVVGGFNAPGDSAKESSHLPMHGIFAFLLLPTLLTFSGRANFTATVGN